MSQQDGRNNIRSSQQSSPPQRQRTQSNASVETDPRQYRKLTKITNIFKRSASVTASSSPNRDRSGGSASGFRTNREELSYHNQNISLSQPLAGTSHNQRLNQDVYPSLSQPSQQRIDTSPTRSQAHNHRYQHPADSRLLKLPHNQSLQPVYRTNFVTPIKESPEKKKRKYYYDHHNEEEYEEHSTSLQIALAADDSPIIRRNKEMRESTKNGGNRRSSLGKRGKRASSVGNGFSAIPHDTIPTNELYKHIDQDLSEPQKMRQLLTWCSSRVLETDGKRHIKQKNLLPQSDITTLNIAKMIKEEIFKDLKDGKINTSWWNPEKNEMDEAEEGKLVLPKKPNERNILNATLLENLKTKLQNLKKDIAEWENLELEHTKNIESAPNFKFDESCVAQMESSSKSSLESREDVFNPVLDESILKEVITMETDTKRKIAMELHGIMDDFNEMAFKLKSAHDLRERFVGLQSQRLTNAINSINGNTNNGFIAFDGVKSSNNDKNINSILILRAISRVQKL